MNFKGLVAERCRGRTWRRTGSGKEGEITALNLSKCNQKRTPNLSTFATRAETQWWDSAVVRMKPVKSKSALPGERINKDHDCGSDLELDSGSWLCLTLALGANIAFDYIRKYLYCFDEFKITLETYSLW